MAAEAADSLLEEARNSGDMDEYLRRLLGGRSVGSFSRAYL
jgi:hypothetical protein